MAHDAQRTRLGQATLKRAETRASETRRVEKFVGLRVPRPAPPLEAALPLRVRGRIGHGFCAADGRWCGLFP